MTQIENTASTSSSSTSAASTSSSSTERNLDCVEDITTPYGVHLSAKFKKSFAYHTVANRMPVIITRIIDHLARSKDILLDEYGDDCKEELKMVIGRLSKLKNEVQTNKPLVRIVAYSRDSKLWNEFLRDEEKKNGGPLYWFRSVWLYVECYMYRRIKEAFEMTAYLCVYDYFKKMKEESFNTSLESINYIADHLMKEYKSPIVDLPMLVKELLRLSLWANRCDLSLFCGKDIQQFGNPMNALDSLDDLIIIDEISAICDIVNKPRTKRDSDIRVIDIVFDNAGYELFADLCLADCLVKYELADEIRLHAKAFPWFVSDVTIEDVFWIREKMACEKNQNLQKLALRFKQNVDQGKWTITCHEFWTLPYPYQMMPKIDIDLYNKFTDSNLILFKGDLNYRKLMGDFNWEHTESFVTALGEFKPAPLAALRTVKSEVITGLREGKAEELAEKDPEWKTIGKYACVSCLKSV